MIKKIILIITFLLPLITYAEGKPVNVIINENLENKKVITIAYENKTSENWKRFIGGVVSVYYKIDTFITEYNGNNLFENDKGYQNLKEKYKNEIQFVKLLEKEGVKLDKGEKHAFFNFIGDGKAINAINNKEDFIYEKILPVNNDLENSFYKVSLDTSKSDINIYKSENNRFNNVYAGKLEIPKNTIIYNAKLLKSETLGNIYLILWFYTKDGIGTAMLSLSGKNNIDLVSNVSGIFINRNKAYEFSQGNCVKNLSYFNFYDNMLLLYCLDANSNQLLSKTIIK